MSPTVMLARRTFLADLGRGAFAIAVLGVAGCAPAATSPTAGSASASSSGPGPSASGAAPSPSGAGGARSWARVDLGFVSAYLLVHGGEAAIVDTGVAGSADAIGETLSSVGLGWDAVGHVILTHNHQDHAGSVADVLGRAAGATGYAGAEDIAGVEVPRALVPVMDGDRVFDLQVVTSPGHTAGSICVLDAASGVLVAGDAMGISGGRPTLPGAQFTDDMDLARTSIVKLGALTFETLLVGHGDPIETGASALVAELAAQS